VTRSGGGEPFFYLRRTKLGGGPYVGAPMTDIDRRALLGALATVGFVPALLSAAGQDTAQVAAPDERAQAALARLVTQQSAFALELHRVLVAAKPDENAFHSPLSVWVALAMLHEGAQATTRDELARALHLPRSASGLRLAANPLREGMAALRTQLDAAREHATLSTADALWFDHGFELNPATLEALRATFGATAEGLDFRATPEPARARINGWVEEQTAGKIVELLPEGAVTPATRLVLTDAVHFLGLWRSPFDPSATRDSHFRRADGSTVSVPFMHLAEAASFPVASFDAAGAPRQAFAEPEDGTTWLELPYRGDMLSFVAIVPDRVDGLPALERTLDPETLGARLALLRPTGMKLRLPRLALRPRYDLVAPLQALGVKAAFIGGAADLSGFAAPEERDARSLHVTGAFHAASLTVDEQGTEAAAATGVVVGRTSAPRFVSVDRPFLFLIRERTSGALLFMGRITDPSR
jgi:serpin B